LLSDDNLTLDQLNDIRSLGVDLSIDDFGTGYSSLSYLRKFPVKTLKIDRSFIMNLSGNTEEAGLVKAILLMAESLNFEVVAEGVETEEQSNFLREMNCQYIQGYLYSKALTRRIFLSF
jgi:EAL domain-containing protein (putative c-di-GMP-specific phosphodiesterase class I)